ncbi:hypothetical protein CCP3SC15_1550007 [Gammaproteobacteria bacterium]
MKYSSGYKYVTRAVGSYQCKHVIPGRSVVLQDKLSGRVLAILSSTGILTWYEYYAWDGASFSPDLESTMLAALIHDILCQMMRLGLLDREIYWHAANREFRDCMLSRGAFKITAWAYFQGVETKLAYQSTLAKNEPKILEVP